MIDIPVSIYYIGEVWGQGVEVLFLSSYVGLNQYLCYVTQGTFNHQRVIYNRNS